MKILVAILVILFVLWLSWSYFATRNIEKPQTISSVMLDGGVELREVGARIEASVVVKGDQGEALNDGFRQLAGYIFGGNKTKESVAMTAPVASTKASSTAIAMTAPVSSEKSEDGYRISFTMPSMYTLDTLPLPDNKSIEFTQIESQKYYVWKFSGYAYESRANKQLADFTSALDAQGIVYSQLPVLNQYNDPWTIPFMRQNEWWIAVD